MTSSTPTNGARTSSSSLAPGQNVQETDVTAVASAILKPSLPMPSASMQIRGIDFNEHLHESVSVARLTGTFARTGFQASSLARAIEIINNMVFCVFLGEADNSDVGDRGMHRLTIPTTTTAVPRLLPMP